MYKKGAICTVGKKKQRKNKNPKPAASRLGRPTWLQRLLLVLTGLFLFVVIEIALRLLPVGVEPRAAQDPLIGFSAVNPLFVAGGIEGGAQWMETAEGKLRWFNRQRFPASKPPGTFRIFSLGGSTTYGRPYSDATSFSGWLRVLLAEKSGSGKRFEVINAGGISYASYRVVNVLRELLRHQPDLFIVYTGHNEFLEARTYRDILDMPPLMRWLRETCSRLETYRILTRTYHKLTSGDKAGTQEVERSSGNLLSPEVQTILDRSAGLDYYQRDAVFSQNVFKHFHLNILRIKRLCREAGVPVLFLEPVDNQKNFSPFKSQPSAALDSRQRQELQANLARGIALLSAERAGEAIDVLRKAVEIDSLYADCHFYLGRAFLVNGDTATARESLLRAREQDICPLRAQVPIHEILRRETAGEEDPDMLDLPGLFSSLSPGGLVGSEQLIDHIHFYPEGNLLIALEAIGWIAEQEYIDHDQIPSNEEINKIYNRVSASLPEDYFRTGVINLAKVLLWAKKHTEALAVMQRHWAELEEIGEACYLMGSIFEKLGRQEQAAVYLHRARELDPGHLMVLIQLAKVYTATGKADSAAAVYEEAIRLHPEEAALFADYGMLMVMGGDYQDALEMFQQAQKLDPNVPGVNNSIGLIYSSREKYDQAIAAFQRELEFTPGDPVIYHNMGIAFSLKKDLARAEKYFNQALQINPEHTSARINLGNIYQDSGRNALAEEQYRMVLSINPGELNAYINLAMLYHASGRKSQGVQVANKGMEYFPDNATLKELAAR